jgi:hypothetical protein
MTSKSCLLLALSLTLSTGGGFADTLMLKDGTQIEGDIIDNQPDAVVIEYSVTPTIKDQKTIPRDRIIKVVTAPEDEKAYAALGSLATPDTVLDTSFYDNLIDKKIAAFIRQYPYTSHISELRAELRRLTAERERVRMGDRKVDGSWVTAAQISGDPYQMEAKLKFSGIKQSAANGDPVAALQAYELFEPAYPNSRVMPDAVDLALSQIELLQGKVSTAEDNFDTLETRRQQSIASVPADQAQIIKDSVDSENQSAKAAMAKANTDGTKFFPVFPNTKEALDSLQSLLSSEKQRLKSLQTPPMRDSLKATASASQLITQGDLAGAKEQLDLASQQWPANAEIAPLRKQLETAIRAAAVKPTPAR